MTYQTLPDASNLTVQGILNFPNLDTPSFYPMFLFVIFFTFAAISLFKEIRREGKGNILSSLAVGGFVTIVVATILSVLEVIQTTVLVTTVVACLVFIVLFLLTKRN